MDAFETSHLSHRALLLDLRTSKGSESRSTAVVLSRIGEVDARELYLQEGYPSMYRFLVHDLNYPEGAAYKRLYAARAARKFPLLYLAVAEGKLHLSGVVLLSRYLTEANVGDLVHAASHKTKAEIEQLIANRFPRRDLPERLQAVAPPPAWLAELSPGKVEANSSPCPAPSVELSLGESRRGFDALRGAVPGPSGPAFPGDSCTAHAAIPDDAACAPALRLSVHRRPGDARALRGSPGSAEPPGAQRGDGAGLQARAPAGEG
jgi:hypothetical protein